MFRFSPLRVCLGAIAFAACGLIGLAVEFPARSGGALSLTKYMSAICSAPLRSASLAETKFMSENSGVMAKMMADMRIAPIGDIDRDFAEMMVAHHEGAIEMAVAVLRHGRNERIRRLAQEIIVTQQEEIGAMRLAVASPGAP
jgi:uncharacterized protein (DUF305 family)